MYDDLSASNELHFCLAYILQQHQEHWSWLLKHAVDQAIDCCQCLSTAHQWICSKTLHSHVPSQLKQYCIVAKTGIYLMQIINIASGVVKCVRCTKYICSNL